MHYESIHYHNLQTEREYRLELTRDILGDLTVTRFYGQQREIFFQPNEAAARAFLATEHDRRLARDYDVVQSLSYQLTHGILE